MVEMVLVVGSDKMEALGGSLVVSSWMKVGGERNEKSFGTLGSPSIVYNML